MFIGLSLSGSFGVVGVSSALWVVSSMFGVLELFTLRLSLIEFYACFSCRTERMVVWCVFFLFFFSFPSVLNPFAFEKTLKLRKNIP